MFDFSAPPPSNPRAPRVVEWVRQPSREIVVDDTPHRGLSSATEAARDPANAGHIPAADPSIYRGPGEASPPDASSGLAGVLRTMEMPQDVMQSAIKGSDKPAEELAQIDEGDRMRAREYLQNLWGGPAKYEANISAVTKYIASLPEKEAEAFLSARDESGTALMNRPDVVVRLAGVARRSQPVAGGQHTIESLEAFMRQNRAEWNRREDLQRRHRELIDERERAKGG